MKKTKTTQKSDVPVVDVYSFSGKKIDKFKLNPDVFSARVNKPLLHQVIVMCMANRRQGTASTKTRGQKRGGGKKPWRQKGTGRARVGSIRSPLWRGGGVVFGPRPRDFGYRVPKKMVKLALISSLSAKSKDKEIMVLEKDPDFTQPKTREMVKILMALKVYNKRILFLYARKNENLMKSLRNIENLVSRSSVDFDTYDVLSNARILFSRETHDAIVKRLSEDTTYGAKRT